MSREQMRDKTFRAPRRRHYSGILVTAVPGHFEKAMAGAAGLAGVEVREADPTTGRFIVTLETDTRQGQEEGLKVLSALEGVGMADLIAHFIDDDDSEEEKS